MKEDRYTPSQRVEDGCSVTKKCALDLILELKMKFEPESDSDSGSGSGGGKVVFYQKLKLLGVNREILLKIGGQND